tara:strand:- start:1481 stop:1681 length:201 start_codon:yes stop_codon:yes gene_type:complete
MRFKQGDLVRVKIGTHEEGMPAHRTGVVVESRNGDGYTKFCKVMFLGSDLILTFHEMFLEGLNENR